MSMAFCECVGRISRRVSPTARGSGYTFVSEPDTEFSAFITLQTIESYSHVFKHNTGDDGCAKVYRYLECKLSHHFYCVRAVQAEASDQIKYSLGCCGDHTHESQAFWCTPSI